MKKTAVLALFLALALLTACAGPAKIPASGTQAPDAAAPPVTGDFVTGDTVSDFVPAGDTAAESAAPVPVPEPSALFSDRDLDPAYDESKCAFIELKGTSAACTSNAVKISGSTVTIVDEGTYVISGILTDGMIVVNAEKTDKTQLVLKNASITSSTSAALYILQADKVFLTLKSGTENLLANGGTFTAIDENNIDGAVFSREDLTINGSGKLTVTSPAGHGIVSKDELTVTGGIFDITCASHGLAGKDSFAIREAGFTIASGKDGIHAENNDDTTLGFGLIQSGAFSISAEGDGISTAAGLNIQGGTFSIVTGGGSVNAQTQTSQFWGSMGGRGGKGGMGGMGGRPFGGGAVPEAAEDSTSLKGIKAGGDLTITGGAFSMDTADDAVHSNANITVSGGTFSIASGDDGFHADDTLTVNDGVIDISKSYEGLEGLHVLVSGGKVSLVASDDGINAAGGMDSSGTGGVRGGDRFGGMGRPGGMMGGASNGSILISGGDLYVQASGDGIDANGTLEITGGHTIVCGPTQGDTATLDYDVSGVISGGTFIGTGGSGMAQSFSKAEQGLIAVRAGSIAAGTAIVLTDSSGKVLLSHSPALNYAVVILSCPEMVSGSDYTLTIGDQSQTITAQ